MELCDDKLPYLPGMSVFHQELQLLYRMEGLCAPTMSQISAIASKLGSSHLLIVEGSKKDLHHRVRLNINQEDVIFALREAPHPSHQATECHPQNS